MTISLEYARGTVVWTYNIANRCTVPRARGFESAPRSISLRSISIACRCGESTNQLVPQIAQILHDVRFCRPNAGFDFDGFVFGDEPSSEVCLRYHDLIQATSALFSPPGIYRYVGEAYTDLGRFW